MDQQLPFDHSFTRTPAAPPARAYAENAIAGLLQSIRRRKGVVAVALLLSLGLAAAVLIVTPKTYRAEAMIQLDFARQDSDAASGAPSASLDANAIVQGEAVVLRSRMIARRVVARLGLALEPRPTWNPLTEIKAWLHQIFPQTASFDPDDPASSVADATPVDRAERELMSRLSISTDNRSYLITIGYTASSAEEAARIANAVADEYLQQRTEAKIASDNRRVGWLESQIVAAMRELSDAEAAVSAYRAKAGLVDSPSGGDAVGDQQLVALTAQALEATTARVAAETRLARVQSLNRSGGAVAAADLQDLPAVQAQIQREAAARKELVDQQARYGSQHPSVMQAQIALNSAAAALSSEVHRSVTGIEANVEAARKVERSLKERLDELRGQVIAAKAGQTTLRNLDDKARAVRERLSSLRRSYDQVLASRALASVAASLSVPAEPVRFPASPKPLVILAMGLLAGLTTGVTGAVLMERRDHGLRSSTEVAAAVGVRCLGMLPELSQAALEDPEPRGRKRGLERTMFDEAIRMVGAGLQLFGSPLPGRVILVTSVMPGEGKSVFLRALADAMTASGQRVLVVNGTPSREDQPALDLQHSQAVVDTSPRDSARQLVVRRTSVTTTANEVFDADHFPRLLNNARRLFDVVLVEGPPVLFVADSIVLSRHADTTILLTKWQSTRRSLIDATLGRLHENSVNVDGLVLNRVNLGRHARLRFVDQCSQYLRQRRFYEGLSGRSKARRTEDSRDGASAA